jgi:TolB-like protein
MALPEEKDASTQPSAVPKSRALVVLPFENRSTDEEQEQSSDGRTKETGNRFIAPVLKSPITLATWKIALPLTAVVLLAATAVGGLLWRARQSRRLTEKDTIVLADFTNTTGDPVFDDTLKQGLRVQLEQSPFLNILSDPKVSEELRLMGRPKDERLTPAVAHDLCQRLGSKAVLAGTISSLGAHYVIGLNAWNCQSGDTFGNEQVEADRREHVLKALGESATNMRKKLGESLASIQKYDAPLEQVTTASLEALKAYSLGVKSRSAKGDTPAIPFFRRAVELDPEFAMATAVWGRITAI